MRISVRSIQRDRVSGQALDLFPLVLSLVRVLSPKLGFLLFFACRRTGLRAA